MRIFLTLNLAWKSLSSNKGRTFLTVLGIIIGIASVIIVMSAGESIKGLILGEFESFGTDYVQIEIKVPSTGRNSSGNAMALASGIEVTTLTIEDAEAINDLSNVKEVGMGIMSQDVVSYLGQNKIVNYFSGNPVAMSVMGVEVERGRMYTQEEDDQLAKVVVLGYEVASDLFGNQDPVGKNIKIGRLRFKVVGVAEERGATFGFDFDNLVYIPVQTTQKLLMGVDYLMFITARLENTDKMDETADQIVMLLRDRHDTENEQEDDFAVTTAKEALDMIDVVFNGITLLLISIAGISLLVGGVGIMNIMYVSVTERTFEIGLRKALGAKSGEILWQFLWEAVVVTLFGGFLGIIVGVLATLLISLGAGAFGFEWSFYLPFESVLLAFAFCAAVGMIFGYYPAKRAADMDPINALRYEA